MRFATVDDLVLWAIGLTLMQFPETGPEVAAGRIFKFAKTRKLTLFRHARCHGQHALNDH